MEYTLILGALAVGLVLTLALGVMLNSVADKFLEKQRTDNRSKNVEITLPLRLQAYERMCLFLERITPNNLLLRTAPMATSALELQQIVLHEIREEYNHNVAQQLYISTHAWEQIVNAMNETVAVVNQAAAEVNAEAPASDLAKKIFSHVIEKEIQPSTHALKVLKEEIRNVF
ncbi:MAG: hypothetical protein BGO21_27140 [Dyadobacter sp. 50-39]|uniref:DUF7935 family protein n=1 Tax=Dyadobacter sp. 50-39 TaxID=1895756 RepID=UPI000960CE87|nr:hypothetical protein [Dyadobacter sp. 50-39]OJV16556.1 MAG: hypothetical protein BGO21_27140 [Dyadobacter sp. 50-39]